MFGPREYEIDAESCIKAHARYWLVFVQARIARQVARIEEVKGAAR
jgi:hypothetical protein